MPQAQQIEPITTAADCHETGTSGGERRSVTEWKNRYSGADIWVIGAGASLNFVDPEFFDGRITPGVNDVYRRFRCTCLVRRSRARIEEAYQTGIPLILSEYGRGRVSSWSWSSPQLNKMSRIHCAQRYDADFLESPV